MDIDEEVEKIESTISSLKDAIEAIQDVPYYEYLVPDWETDLMELQGTLDSLLEKQNQVWKREIKEQTEQYYKSVL